MNTAALDRYGALVREYHRTLDLVSPAALKDWDSLLADALLYGELIDELLPAVPDRVSPSDSLSAGGGAVRS